jgi:hypothetical protein
VRCVIVQVVLGAVSVSTLPLSSTAAQNEVVGHETELRLLVASMSSLIQVAAPPAGDAEANALPSPSTATQEETEGQVMLESPDALPSTAARVHAAAPPVGLLEVSTPPPSSTATQSVVDGHDRPSIENCPPV